MLLSEEDQLSGLGRGFKKLIKKANPIARLKKTVAVVKKVHAMHKAKSPIMKLHAKHMAKSPVIKAIKKNPNIAILAASFIPVIGTVAAAAGKMALMVKQKREAEAAAAEGSAQQAAAEQEAEAAQAAYDAMASAPPEYEASAVGAGLIPPEAQKFLPMPMPVPGRGGFIPAPYKPGPGGASAAYVPNEANEIPGSGSPELSPEEARQKFSEWLQVWNPGVAQRIEAENPALLGEVSLGSVDPNTGDWEGLGDFTDFMSDWGNTISDVAQKIIPVALQYKTMKVQVERAKAGKPPLPTPQAQALAVRPPQPASLFSMPAMPVILGLGALAFGALMFFGLRPTGRRR
jgi:hypothetical protein